MGGKRTSSLIQSLFDVNHPFWQRVEWLFDIMLLNLLTFLASLPLLTLGIAKLALQASLWEMEEAGKIKIWSTYWRQFGRHWKEGLVLSVVELGVTLFCLFDLYLIWGQPGLFFDGFRAVCIAILMFSQLLWVYLYPLAARYSLGLRDLLLKSVLLLGSQLVLTLKVSLAYILLGAVLLYSGLTLLIGLVCLLSFAYAGLSYLFIKELRPQLTIYEKEIR